VGSITAASVTSVAKRAIVKDCSALEIGASTQSRILAVIVLYKSSIDRSSTCISIRDQSGYDRDAFTVLVYDNSPIANSTGLPSDWMYVSDPINNGLPAAYNHAILRCKELGAHWVLLLDQDSRLPANFLVNLQADAALCYPQPKIAAIVPRVFSKQRQVSPFLPKFGLDRPYVVARSTTSAWLTAINSAACIRVSFVESIGGFSRKFWLDYLDHWLFRKIYDTAHSVFVSEMRVEHDLSVANFNEGLEVSRYRNILSAERTFTNEYLPRFWRPLLAFRLMARAGKHIVSTRNKRMASLMFHASLRQFFSILYWNSTEDVNSDGREIASTDEGKMSAS
jgi:GT2 family glycosyltransferase